MDTYFNDCITSCNERKLKIP